MFIIHISSLIAGFSSMLVASTASLLYFIKHQELKTKHFTSWIERLPSLNQLDRIAVKALWGCVVLLTFANATGIVVAHLMDPKGEWVHSLKFIFAMATWAWFCLLLLIRYRFGVRGLKFFSMVLMGFIVLVFTVAIALSREHLWK